MDDDDDLHLNNNRTDNGIRKRQYYNIILYNTFPATIREIYT